MNRYFFQIGDLVTHYDNDVVGRITGLITCEEGERKYEEDPNNPWYTIEWFEDMKFCPNCTYTDGFEHQSSLLPLWVNRIPLLITQKLHKANYDLWKQLGDEAREEDDALLNQYR